jgi:O-antigen ligase
MSGIAGAGRAAGAGLLIALGAAAAAGAVCLLLRPGAWTPLAAAAGAALAAAAWARPVWAAAALLALAPICGNRPTTGPFLFFVTLTAWAVPVWLARLALRERARALAVVGSPLGLALCAYAAVSALSLSSLPLYAPASIVGAETATEALRRLPAAMAAADVLDPVYSVLTVVLTLHALVAALVIAVALPARGERAPAIDAAVLIGGALLTGLTITLAAAALDSLAMVDLRRLRSFDPVTRALGGDRLQSTFGHAGWLAQYLCYTTPAVLALWLWPPQGTPPSRVWLRARPAAAVALLAATLVAIVFSLQRGGWITWAVVGGATVAAVAGLAALDLGPGRARPSTRRLLLTATAAVVVAVTAAVLIVRVGGGPGAVDRFSARLRTIAQVSDRQHHVVAGLRLGAQLPVLGGGSESFARRFREEYLLAGGAYYARGYSPVQQLYGSAHNVFVQTFAGKGAAGLVALVLVVVAAGAAVLRRLREGDAAPRARVVAAMAAGMLLGFVLYGQVQEVFYIPVLQLTVFAGFGLAWGLEPTAPAAGAGRLGRLAAVLVAILGAHLIHGYVAPGRLAEGYRDYRISADGARLSAPVLGEDGVYFQWTGARAVVTVPRQATELSLELRRPSAEARVVEIRFDGRLVDSVRLDAGEWRRVVYPLGKVRALPRRLELLAAPGGTPGGRAADPGVAVRRIRWGDE